MSLAILQPEIGRLSDWSKHVRLPIAKLETSRRNADYRVRLSIKIERHPDRARIGSESALP
jgi:hypothetical protein